MNIGYKVGELIYDANILLFDDIANRNNIFISPYDNI